MCGVRARAWELEMLVNELGEAGYAKGGGDGTVLGWPALRVSRGWVACRRLRQKDCKFEATLCCIARLPRILGGEK